MPLALIRGPLSSVSARRGTTLLQKALQTELMSRGAKVSADSAFFWCTRSFFFFNPRLHSHLSLMQGTHLNVTRSIMWPAKEKQNDVSYKRALSGRSERLNNDFFFFFFPSLNLLTAYRCTTGTTSLTCCLAFLPFHPCLCVWRIYNFSCRFVRLFVWVAAYVCPHTGGGEKPLCSFGWKWPTVVEVTSVAS